MTTTQGNPSLEVRPKEALTPRESEVASWVSAGLSNHQIARRMGISRWTVANHLRRIMCKWSCASRVDVAVRVAVSERSKS